MFDKYRKLLCEFPGRFVFLKRLIFIWDILYVGVIGVNSFILLVLNNRNEHKLIYVICAMAVLYITVLLTILIKFRKSKQLRKILYSARKIFRIIYTAIYLTIIMLHLIRLGLFNTIQDEDKLNVTYNIISFIFILIVGSSSFWWKKAVNLLNRVR